MSKKIFDNYIDNAFDNTGQADFKKGEFRFNYFKYLPKNREAQVLDIGVGRGEMLTCLKEQGYKNYLGIDISPSTVSFCQKLELNCQVVEDSLTWLVDHKKTYSLITLLDVLEHFELDFAINFLKAAHEALTPDGILIIQVPNAQAPDGHLHFFNDVTHKFAYLEHSLKQILVSAGVTKIEIFGYENIVKTGFKSKVKMLLRYVLRAWTRFTRVVHGNLNPEILSPVLYAVVRK